MSSLQEVSSQLLLDAAGDDSVEAKEKVHVASNRLHLLLRQVDADLPALQHRLVPDAPRGTLRPRRRSYRWFCVLQEVSRAESAGPEDGEGVGEGDGEGVAPPQLFQEVAGGPVVGPAPPRR